MSAKILSQLQSAGSVVPIQILAIAKGKEPPADALPTLVDIYTKLKRVGIITKDNTSGKLIDDWNEAVSEAESKPETVDMSPAVSAVLAVKDEEELVSALILSALRVGITHSLLEMYSYCDKPHLDSYESSYCTKIRNNSRQRSRDIA